MNEWRAEVAQQRKAGRSWTEIARLLRDTFPELTETQISHGMSVPVVSKSASRDRKAHAKSLSKNKKMNYSSTNFLSNHRLHGLHRFSSIASPQAPTIARRIYWQIMKSNRKEIPTVACGSAV